MIEFFYILMFISFLYYTRYPTNTLIETDFDSRNISYICEKTNTFIKKSYKHEFDTLVKLQDIDEVVNVIRSTVTNSEYYIVMPYLQNWVTLCDYTGDREAFIGLFIKICCGLDKIHNMGVLHCDIKPDNIMVSPEEEIVFIDFEETGGTSGYIAPEIIHDKFDESIYTVSVDIWSLGMTMLNVYTPISIGVTVETNTDISKYIDILSTGNEIGNEIDNEIDNLMATLFKKILCIIPHERIGLTTIIDELKQIKTVTI